MTYSVYARVRTSGSIGVFVVRGFQVEAPDGATAEQVQAAWFDQHGAASNAPVKWELHHFCNLSSLRVEPLTAYRDGNDKLRRIMHQVGTVEGQPAFASVEGEMFALDGRLVLTRQTSREPLTLENYLAPLGHWGNLARLDLSQRYHENIGWRWA